METNKQNNAATITGKITNRLKERKYKLFVTQSESFPLKIRMVFPLHFRDIFYLAALPFSKSLINLFFIHLFYLKGNAWIKLMLHNVQTFAK